MYYHITQNLACVTWVTPVTHSLHYKNCAWGGISQRKIKTLNYMVTHTWKLISHAWLFIRNTTSPVSSVNFLKCLDMIFQVNHIMDPRNFNFYTTVFFNLHSSPQHPSLLFTEFYTCILFHAFINLNLPCPHFSSNKRSCIKSVNSDLRNRGRTCVSFLSFRPTGHRLARRNLKSYIIFYTSLDIQIGTGLSPESMLNCENLCYLYGEEMVAGSDSSPRITG